MVRIRQSQRFTGIHLMTTRSSPLSRLRCSLSGFGLILGSLFFAASLTPSLIPRSFEVQGVLAGVAFTCGYGIGAFFSGLWVFLQIPRLTLPVFRIAKGLLALACVSIMLVALYKSGGWQNSIRAVLDMPPVDSGYPISVSAIALLTFCALLLIVRGLISLGRRIAGILSRYLPHRVALVAAASITTLLTVTLANGVLVKYTFQLLDASFQKFDSLLEPDRPQPLIAERAGNPASQLDWRKLGRAGREFVASGPNASEISNLTGRAALEPIRLYAGLQVAETPEERAQTLLDELIRVKAFDRAALVIITPTGTGWVDPSAMDGLEFLYDGDVASVALQYSYLNSPLSLLFQPEYGLDSSQALFRAIYAYWTELPVDGRPKLYLHGLSLGAFNSQRSITFFDILGDPIQGAVWSGPPFPSEKWRSITNGRDAGSTEWLPVFQDGRFVRFMNQDGTPDGNTDRWGNMRFMYLQYASDAITFFDRSLLYREADWMKAPRGPDVSPLLTWYPVVSMLQLLIDMPLADTVPMGFGHVYAPEHYLRAWLEVTGIDHWNASEIDTLEKLLIKRSERGEGYSYRGG